VMATIYSVAEPHARRGMVGTSPCHAPKSAALYNQWLFKFHKQVFHEHISAA
jgi:hypothetical protein